MYVYLYTEKKSSVTLPNWTLVIFFLWTQEKYVLLPISGGQNTLQTTMLNIQMNVGNTTYHGLKRDGYITLRTCVITLLFSGYT